MINAPATCGRFPALLITAILLLAAGLLPACTPIHGDDPATLSSRVDQPPDPAYAEAVERARSMVRTFVVDENLPGLSVAVAVAGDIVWAEGFGWADIQEKRAVTPQTRFRIGNVAVPMTATAAGLLHEQGSLDLDASVRQYVPDFPEKEWAVTTRQLMGHVAGVRGYGDDEEPLYLRRHCETARDALALFADDPLLFEPGTRYRYSDYGWTLVGAVIEAVADKPVMDFLRSQVLDPLQMQDTVLDDPGPDPARTSFYWPSVARDPGFGVESAIREGAENTCLQGAGSLLSTPTDLVRFGLSVLDRRLLSAATAEMLQTPLELDSGESTGYGLGWFVREVPVGTGLEPTLVLGHEGSSVGGTTSLVILPEHGIVIATAANVSFARSVATDPELGGGARPFFRVSALPHGLADTFVQAMGH